MARPAKAVNTQNSNLTAAEREIRAHAEESLRGGRDRITPPGYLTEAQREIFQDVVNELAQSDILGNVDVYVLASMSVTVDRLRYIEGRINEDAALLENSAFMASKDKYTREFYRCCNELCMSPQSRAKIGSAHAQAAKGGKNPLLAWLTESDDED